ncbi:MAG: DegT/DnrJ/EryC1/StrS aminotransferase family protein [Candidatus Schekmanbacteria bacterium]|nr:DegT/DnrJ/EryC1/StrS aminotransferase family protein [Candidatus Schekmanbacteria bacterium]
MTIKNPIPHSKPCLGKDEISAAIRVIKSGMLSSGEEVQKFESEFKKYISVKYASAVNSGTSALHLALLALNIKAGDEVIIPTFVCTALLNAVNYTGATPVIADVSPDDGNIMLQDVKKKLTRRTKAIIVPHMFGSPADIKGIASLGVPVIEDCAQAIGAEQSNRKAGGIGQISIFSFYATKMMTTAEGGMVLSNDRKLIDKVNDLRSYDHRDDYKVRFNYKMTDIAAAIGRCQLLKIESFIKSRRAIADYYRQKIKSDNLFHPAEKSGTRHVFFRYVIRLNKMTAINTVARFKRLGVNTELPLYLPLHRYLGLDNKNYLGAEKLYREALSIPIYPALKKIEMNKVASSAKEIIIG